MSNWCRVLSPAFLLLAASCQPGPIERFDSPRFNHPPEILEKDGQYHVRVYDHYPDPVGSGLVEYRRVDGDIYVWLAGRHSSGSRPVRILELGIPVKTPAPRFFWVDPDETLHPLQVVAN